MGRRRIRTSDKKSYKEKMKEIVLLFFMMIFLYTSIFGQKVKTTINAYGHIDFQAVHENDSLYSNFKLGEQEVFINSKFNKNFSLLAEMTMNFMGHGMYRFNIERLRLKYNYFGNHSAIIGKFHTPVNYWNDVYFHARLFFPTIDRPLMFSKWIPVHTIGGRLQGQNLGKYNFGYDLLVGGGMSSEDMSDILDEISVTAGVHWKPTEDTRFGFTYYTTSMDDASSMAAHSHGPDDPGMPVYDGPLDFQLISSSVAYFGTRWELLNEFSYNRTKTDTLGVANNLSNYIYCGYRVKEKNVPFVAYDIVYSEKNDLHTHGYNRMKFVLGYKYEFTTNLNLKAQLEYYRNILQSNSLNPMIEFKIQISYGL